MDLYSIRYFLYFWRVFSVFATSYGGQKFIIGMWRLAPYNARKSGDDMMFAQTAWRSLAQALCDNFEFGRLDGGFFDLSNRP